MPKVDKKVRKIPRTRVDKGSQKKAVLILLLIGVPTLLVGWFVSPFSPFTGLQPDGGDGDEPDPPTPPDPPITHRDNYTFGYEGDDFSLLINASIVNAYSVIRIIIEDYGLNDSKTFLLMEGTLHEKGINVSEIKRGYNQYNAGFPAIVGSEKVYYDVRLTFFDTVNGEMVKVSRSLEDLQTDKGTESEEIYCPVERVMFNAGSTDLIDEYSTDEDTILLMHLNESSGDAIDSSGNELNGLAQNGVNQGVDGKFLTTCYEFDGIDDSIDIAHSGLSFSNEISIEAWVFKTSHSFSRETIVATYHQSFSNYSFFAGTRYYGRPYFVLMREDGSTRSLLASPSNRIPLNQWIHMVYDYNGASLRIFMDGVQIASNTWSGTLASVNNEINIGSSHNGTDNFFTGKIEEVRISNKSRIEGTIGPGHFNYNYDKLHYNDSFYINFTSDTKEIDFVGEWNVTKLGNENFDNIQLVMDYYYSGSLTVTENFYAYNFTSNSYDSISLNTNLKSEDYVATNGTVRINAQFESSVLNDWNLTMDRFSIKILVDDSLTQVNWTKFSDDYTSRFSNDSDGLISLIADYNMEGLNETNSFELTQYSRYYANTSINSIDILFYNWTDDTWINAINLTNSSSEVFTGCLTLETGIIPYSWLKDIVSGDNIRTNLLFNCSQTEDTELYLDYVSGTINSMDISNAFVRIFDFQLVYWEE